MNLDTWEKQRTRGVKAKLKFLVPRSDLCASPLLMHIPRTSLINWNGGREQVRKRGGRICGAEKLTQKSGRSSSGKLNFHLPGDAFSSVTLWWSVRNDPYFHTWNRTAYDHENCYYSLEWQKNADCTPRWRVLPKVTRDDRGHQTRLLCCKNGTVALGHHFLDCLIDAMYDHSISCPYQRLCFPYLLYSYHVAKPCRSVEHSSM